MQTKIYDVHMMPSPTFEETLNNYQYELVRGKYKVLNITVLHFSLDGAPAKVQVEFEEHHKR